MYGHGIWRLNDDDILSSWILIAYAVFVVVDYVCGKPLVQLWWLNKRLDWLARLEKRIKELDEEIGEEEGEEVEENGGDGTNGK